MIHEENSFRGNYEHCGIARCLGGVALAAQDRSTLKVPNGLAFSEFEGYENWQYVAVSQTATSVKIIAANPVMIEAFRKGVPGNHQPFPEGSKIVKIEWLFKKNTESPYFVDVPDTLKTLAFIEKDSKRFPDTHGWAYAVFINDPATDTLTPDGSTPAKWDRCHMRLRVPHDGSGERLHLHSIPQEVNRAGQ